MDRRNGQRVGRQRFASRRVIDYEGAEFIGQGINLSANSSTTSRGAGLGRSAAVVIRIHNRACQIGNLGRTWLEVQIIYQSTL